MSFRRNTSRFGNWLVVLASSNPISGFASTFATRPRYVYCLAHGRGARSLDLPKKMIHLFKAVTAYKGYLRDLWLDSTEPMDASAVIELRL